MQVTSDESNVKPDKLLPGAFIPANSGQVQTPRKWFPPCEKVPTEFDFSIFRL